MKQRFMSYEQISENSGMSLPSDVLKISQLFTKAGKKLYVVGGAVRDFLLGKMPKDYDLATDALPDETIKILKGHYPLKEVGKAFGVVIATGKDKEDYEIATFREDKIGNSDFQGFVRYIEKTKPDDYQKRLHLLSKMSGERLP